MFIFGWGHQTIKVIGVAFKNLCSHCNNENYWTLTRIRTWFSLFFIPVIPYSTKYFLACPICQYGLTLNQQQIEEILPIAEANQLLIDGKITEIEHQSRVSQVNHVSSDYVEAEVIETKKLEDVSPKHGYCGECGSPVTQEMNFCRNCGTKK